MAHVRLLIGAFTPSARRPNQPCPRTARVPGSGGHIGDTDLNGIVDGSDLANLLAGMRGGLTVWANGDTNYDGVVKGTGLSNLLASPQHQGAPFGELFGGRRPGARTWAGWGAGLGWGRRQCAGAAMTLEADALGHDGGIEFHITSGHSTLPSVATSFVASSAVRSSLREHGAIRIAWQISQPLLALSSYTAAMTKTFSTACFVLGFASIVGSIAVWFLSKGSDQAHGERFGIFVGLWAPTFFILSSRFESAGRFGK